jgi:hypothetical protein
VVVLCETVTKVLFAPGHRDRKRFPRPMAHFTLEFSLESGSGTDMAATQSSQMKIQFPDRRDMALLPRCDENSERKLQQCLRRAIMSVIKHYRSLVPSEVLPSNARFSGVNLLLSPFD